MAAKKQKQNPLLSCIRNAASNGKANPGNGSKSISNKYKKPANPLTKRIAPLQNSQKDKISKNKSNPLVFALSNASSNSKSVSKNSTTTLSSSKRRKLKQKALKISVNSSKKIHSLHLKQYLQISSFSIDTQYSDLFNFFSEKFGPLLSLKTFESSGSQTVLINFLNNEDMEKCEKELNGRVVDDEILKVTKVQELSPSSSQVNNLLSGFPKQTITPYYNPLTAATMMAAMASVAGNMNMNHQITEEELLVQAQFQRINSNIDSNKINSNGTVKNQKRENNEVNELSRRIGKK